MKYTLLFWLMLAYSSCHLEDERVPLLSYADSLIQSGRADSALIKLENISQEDLSTSASRARYALLLTQARDKNYILHTSDSLIRIAVDYYDSTDDILSCAKAHYYLGRVYQDMNNIEGTVREFLTAMPLVEEVDDYDLTCLLHGNLGYLLWQNGLLNEADSLYEREISLTELHKDSLNWALVLSKRADICLERGEGHYEEAEKYLKQALSLMGNDGNIHIRRTITSTLGLLYERMGLMEEVLHWTRYGLSLQADLSKCCDLYLILGSAYTKQEQYDSAFVYLNKCLLSANPYIKEGAYMRLADLSKAKGKFEDALLYENYYSVYKDSIALLEKPVKVATLIKEIVYQQEIRKYESSLYHYRYYLLLLGMSGFTLIMYIFYRHRKERYLSERYRIISSQVEEMQEALRRKEDEIDAIQQQQSVNRLQINNCLTAILDEKKEMQSEMENLLKQKNTIIKELSKKKFGELLEETDIYKRIQYIRKENEKREGETLQLTDADWEELENEIIKLFPEFIETLCSKYELLSKNDIRFLCLIKAGFKHSDISCILSCSLNAVYKREKAVKMRMQLGVDIKLRRLLADL